MNLGGHVGPTLVSTLENEIQEVSRMIRHADYVIALTGAGISKESNVPTFRGPDGLWNNYDVMELATPSAFARNPKLVWEWYSWRQGLISECHPNPAHTTLAKWEKQNILRSIITQNVDGLHRRAGSQNVLEVHGNLWATRCTFCSFKGRLSEPAKGMPTCPSCGKLLRPLVVWFGEGLPQDVMAQVYNELDNADLCLVIGTSALVQPAASFPIVVKQKGGILVEVNVEVTPLTKAADYHLEGMAGVILPQIDAELQGIS
ncbi:MAG: NAD-dependent deacylase [Candidatus Thorarchaeota archaeon]|nr:NAD-dependent deacylase [Candidatus Thorarchaeota archaeon]